METVTAKMRSRRNQWLCLAAAACVAAATAARAEAAQPGGVRIEESLDVAKVPAGFPVGFSLLTRGGRQFVAYYDADHNMTVASRKLGSDKWQYKVLPSKVGWDSHNYLTLTADDEGYLHLSGNMHAVPLVYFRTSKPWDIETFQQVRSMTGTDENSCTYPAFMRGADGRLIFHYRAGRSGNGKEIYNVYEPKSKEWKRLSDVPIIDGRGARNAYMSGPVRGPDGMFHLCWVWRDSPDCRSNHDPSYARSADLVHWQTIGGAALALPITIGSPGTLVDAVPPGGGIINGSVATGFDSSKRPLVSYIKFDGGGKTQAYVARFEDGKWIPHQITAWDYRWEFGGGGSIQSEIHLGAPRPSDKGKLVLPYSHIKSGSGLLVIDEKSLQLLGTTKPPRPYPDALCKPESRFPGMAVRWLPGDSDDGSARYVLRWEALPPNRDRPRQEPLPDPGMLRVYKLGAEPVNL